MRHRPIAILLGAALAGGCSLLPGMEEERPAPPGKSITCREGPDCQVKWSRAATWVAQASSAQIRVQTDSRIQSMEPVTSGSEPIYTVTRLPGANGVNEIIFDLSCRDQPACTPTVAEARASFEKYILDTP